jgi:hypothetical protein
MIVTVAAMRVMEVSADDIVDMVTMWDPFMTARRAVSVILCMTFAGVIRRAGIRIHFAHRDCMLVDVAGMRIVHVTVMKIIGMTVVRYGVVSTTGAVRVIVSGVLVTFGFHGISLLRSECLS